MPLNILDPVLEIWRNFPCCRSWLKLSMIFGFTGTFAEAVAPNTPIGWGGVIASLTALVIALGTIRREQRESSRKDRILDARLNGFEEKQGRNTRLLRVQGKGLQGVRNKQVKMEDSLREIESLRNIGLLADGPATETISSILIIDDDPNFVNTLGRFLIKNLGPFNLLKALTFDEAMHEIQKRPSRIFLDIRLGDRSGLEIIPHAKSYNPDVKVVIITGWNDPDELEGAVMLGDEVLRKSGQIEHLARIVKAMQREFGSPLPSNSEIPILGASDSPHGIDPDDSSA